MGELNGHQICVVDDDVSVLATMKDLLESSGCEVRTFENGDELLDIGLERYEGCVLLDVGLPIKDGMTVLSEALEKNPNLPVVMMSSHGNIPMAVKSIKKGALDFIEKPIDVSELYNKMSKACEEFDILRDRQAYMFEARMNYAKLTPREKEICEKLVDGKSNKIIAFELGISTRTVETHRARINAKLQSKSIAELVRLQMAATQ